MRAIAGIGDARVVEKILRHCGAWHDALKRTCADMPPPERQRQGRSSVLTPPKQWNSSKHVASMFLGCSLHVLSFPSVFFPQPHIPLLLPTAGL
jgi:hypothetical protein